MPKAISCVRNVISKALTSYSTNFPATENPISQGGIWLNGGADGIDWKDIQSSGGYCYASAFDPGGTHDPVAQLKRSFLACTRNQYSEGVAHIGGSETGSHEIEVFVNMTITANSITGYECYVSRTGNHTLVRWNGPVTNFTALASNNISTFTAPAEGDVIRVTNVNGLLSCYQNGTLRTTATDNTYTGGNPGLGNNPDSSAAGTVTLNGIGWKTWSCGNL